MESGGVIVGRRRRRFEEQSTNIVGAHVSLGVPGGGDDDGDDDDPSGNSRQLLTMSINHMKVFVLILYGLYAICRFGFGWDPTKKDDPTPPTYTLHIKGITDDTAIGPTGHITFLRGSQQE
jgi:hypothetical protein